MSVEPEATGGKPCRGCSRLLPEETLRCDHCGAMQSDDVRCPHCGAAASTSADGELRIRCDVCGGARLPYSPAVRPGDKAAASLRKVEAARKARAGWRTALFLGGLALPTSGLFFGLLLLAFSASFPLLATAFLVLTPLALVTALALRRTREKTKEIAAALDEAWLLHATDVANQAEEPLTAPSLARLMGLSESQAEELLALLEAGDVVRSELTDDGELLYHPKLRIGAQRAAGSKTERARVSAEERAEVEALAELEAEVEAEAARAKGGA